MGLGEMKVESYLDQPFKAEIELIDVGNTPLTGIQASIADPENFAHVGLDRAAVLSLLDFKIQKNKQGKVVIVIQSKERMTEPYMQMVIDLTWSKGQIYKVYTVLLDPPGYQLVKKTAEGGLSYSKEATGYRKETNVTNQGMIAHVESQKTTSQSESKVKQSYGPTITNENVWQIAQRYKTADITLPQVVLAIVGANPEAFSQGNLNGLKVGVRLNIPFESEILQVPSELATQEVMAHDKAWNDKLPIDHVIAPPYIGGEKLSQPPATYSSELPGIPKMESPGVSLPSGKTTLIQPSTTVPVESNEQDKQFKLPHSTESAAKTQAELSITSAAVDSIRTSNALLTEQLKALQEQNKKLQEQLDQSNKDMKLIRSQLQLMIKERKGASSQASSAMPPSQSSDIWPLIVLLMALSGGGGFVYWYVIKRKQRIVSQPLMEPQKYEEEQVQHKEETLSPRPTEAAVSILSIEPKAEVTELPQDGNPPEKVKLVTAEEESRFKPHPSPEVDIDIPHEVEEASQIEGTQPEETLGIHSQGNQVVVIENPPAVQDKKESVASNEVTKSSTELSLIDYEPSAKVEPTTEPSIQLSAETQQFGSTIKTTLSPGSTDTHKELLVEASSAIQKDTDAKNWGEEDVTEEPALIEFESGLHEKLERKQDQGLKTSKESEETIDLGLDFDVETVLESQKHVAKEVDKKRQVKNIESVNLEDFFSENKSNQPTEPIQEKEQVQDTAQENPEPSQEEEQPSEIEFELENKAEVSAEEEDNKTTSENHDTSRLKSTKALNTLLALARTYISMGDYESAKQSLDEVAAHGTEPQKEQAKLLLEEIKGK